jgi:hypothetical protein
VNVRTLLITLGAVLALAVPSAYAAGGKQTSDHGKLSKAKAAAVRGASHHRGSSAPSRIVVVTGAPASSTALTASVDDLCIVFVNNCTAQENCEIWGLNCGQT